MFWLKKSTLSPLIHVCSDQEEIVFPKIHPVISFDTRFFRAIEIFEITKTVALFQASNREINSFSGSHFILDL